MRCSTPTTTFLLACLALLDTSKASSHVNHRAHRFAHRAAGARGVDDHVEHLVLRDIDIVTETVYETTYVDYVPPTVSPTVTSTIVQYVTASSDPTSTATQPSVVVVYSSVFVLPVPVDSVFTGLASATPVTNTFTAPTSTSPTSTSKSTSKGDAIKAEPAKSTSKKIIPSVKAATTSAAPATTLIKSTIPAAAAVPTANSDYSSTVTDAISAMSASYSTYSLQWADVHGWIAANAYNDIMDYDFYTKSTSYSATYGAALLSVATSTNYQGMVLSTDGYNDDQLWWCLAMLRAYQNYGHAELLNQAAKQWEAIGANAQLFSSDQGKSVNKGGLARSQAVPSNCDVDGAVYWSSEPDSTINAISTNLYAQVGAWLFELTGDTKYRGPSDAALGWLQRMMLNGATGIMNIDSVTVAGCQKHFGSLTYNTGVYIGALTSFYRSTGDQKYLNSAIQSVTSSVTGSFGNSPALVVGEEGDINSLGDDVQWRDVLFRNLVDFHVSLVPKGSVSSDLQSKTKAFFTANLNQINSKAKFGNLYSANWFGGLNSGSDWGTASVLSALNGGMMVL